MGRGAPGSKTQPSPSAGTTEPVTNPRGAEAFTLLDSGSPFALLRGFIYLPGNSPQGFTTFCAF